MFSVVSEFHTWPGNTATMKLECREREKHVKNGCISKVLSVSEISIHDISSGSASPTSLNYRVGHKPEKDSILKAALLVDFRDY